MPSPGMQLLPAGLLATLCASTSVHAVGAPSAPDESGYSLPNRTRDRALPVRPGKISNPFAINAGLGIKSDLASYLRLDTLSRSDRKAPQLANVDVEMPLNGDESDFGLAYPIRPSTQLDVGSNIGLNPN